jgi:hypothetical protein
VGKFKKKSYEARNLSFATGIVNIEWVNTVCQKRCCGKSEKSSER